MFIDAMGSTLWGLDGAIRNVLIGEQCVSAAKRRLVQVKNVCPQTDLLDAPQSSAATSVGQVAWRSPPRAPALDLAWLTRSYLFSYLPVRFRA